MFEDESIFLSMVNSAFIFVSRWRNSTKLTWNSTTVKFCHHRLQPWQLLRQQSWMPSWVLRAGGGGGLSTRGKHCFSLEVYGFCNNIALYSASLSFVMFIFLLTPFDTKGSYYSESNLCLVLLIKVFFYKKNHTHIKKVGHTSEFRLGICWWTWKTNNY